MTRILLVLVILFATRALAGTAPCDVPMEQAEGMVIGREPIDPGFDAARLCAALQRFARDPANLHALLVERHGRIVAEVYRSGPDESIYSMWRSTVAFGPETRHDVRSISKSVVSLLWGIAQGQGKTPPMDTGVLDLLPELADLRNAGRERITLDHLMSMRSGLEWNESAKTYGTLTSDETALYWKGDQARFLFDRRLASEPGTHYNYNGGHTAVIAELLSTRTRVPLVEFARQNLFQPLGITDWEWRSDLRGRPVSFAGLRLRPRDLAKIGRMVLDKGKWEGTQVVPAEWIVASLTPRILTGEGPGYAYQWWTGAVQASGHSYEWRAGFGNGGQRLFLVPALDLVVVFAAGEYNNPRIGRNLAGLLAEIAAAVR